MYRRVRLGEHRVKREEIRNVIGEHQDGPVEALKAQGQSILLIDKNLDALLRIADRHYVMEKGRVVWQGKSAALANDERLKSRYLGV